MRRGSDNGCLVAQRLTSVAGLMIMIKPGRRPRAVTCGEPRRTRGPVRLVWRLLSAWSRNVVAAL
jgi:hypothetical protein